MNDLDLLWELAQETPLPDPAELGTARAQLVAAITVDPEAGRSTGGPARQFSDTTAGPIGAGVGADRSRRGGHVGSGRFLAGHPGRHARQ